MIAAIVSGVCSAILSWGLTRWLCSPASRFRHLDHPNERSLHTRPTPRTGGIAIVASIYVGASLLWIEFIVATGGAPAGGSGSEISRLKWVLAPVLVVAFTSFWDDRVGLSAPLRLGIHLAAALGLVWGGGLSLTSLDLPGGGALLLGSAALPLSVGLVVWMTNLYKFIDGMDGLAGGMSVSGFGTLALVALGSAADLLGALSLLAAAAAAGFLWYNLPPARIFMGDVGSTSLGFLAGALTLWGSAGEIFEIWVPLLAFSPFVVDASATLARRLARGERVWEAHRAHFYQRLVLAGWGHRKTLGAGYLLMMACGVSAIAYTGVTKVGRLTLIGSWVLIYVALAFAVRAVERARAGSGKHP